MSLERANAGCHIVGKFAMFWATGAYVYVVHSVFDLRENCKRGTIKGSRKGADAHRIFGAQTARWCDSMHRCRNDTEGGEKLKHARESNLVVTDGEGRGRGGGWQSNDGSIDACQIGYRMSTT